MRLCFSGLEEPLEINPGYVSVLEIHSHVLFSRICDSIHSELGEDAIEPYSIWEGERELSPSSQILFVSSPLQLPWNHRALLGSIGVVIEKMMLEDNECRESLEALYRSITSEVMALALQLQSDYCFSSDWDIMRFIKAFGLNVEYDVASPLFDKLIRFLYLAKDVSLSRVVAFVNLKNFLSRNDLECFYQQVFFSNLKVLLIEGSNDRDQHEYEIKCTIDQALIEY